MLISQAGVTTCLFVISGYFMAERSFSVIDAENVFPLKQKIIRIILFQFGQCRDDPLASLARPGSLFHLLQPRPRLLRLGYHC